MPLNNNSNLPSIQRLKYEDYQGAPKWFAQFLNTLNLFISAVYNIINGGILYSNLGVLQPYTFMYTPGSTTGFKFTNPLTVNPNNVILGNVYVTGNTTSHPSAAVSLFWHFSGGYIYVDSLIGLTSGTSYTISVLVC